MSNPSVKTEKAASSGSFNRLFASILIPVALVIGYFVFKFILGSPGNFVDNNPEGHPLPGNYLGMMYKGGCLLYTSDAADERSSVDLGGRRIIKKKNDRRSI